jgi:regulator of RNase E activity RraA
MAARIKHLGALGIVVDGRVRDLSTLRELQIPVWSRGTSIVGSGGETKAWAMGEEINIGHCFIRPGDIVMIDYVEGGTVVIPKKAVEEILEMLPKLVEADEGAMNDVLAGGEVGDAFRKWRG